MGCWGTRCDETACPSGSGPLAWPAKASPSHRCQKLVSGWCRVHDGTTSAPHEAGSPADGASGLAWSLLPSPQLAGFCLQLQLTAARLSFAAPTAASPCAHAPHTHLPPPEPAPLHPPLCSCPAAASSPRNVGEASFLRKALGACLLLPPCLVSPGFSFLSSHPCSSFLPFDVPPLLCSRAGAACQVEVSAPHPTISCDRRFSFSLTPCSVWPGSQHHRGQQSPAVCPSRWWDQPQAGPSSQGSSTSALLQGIQGSPGLTLYRWPFGGPLVLWVSFGQPGAPERVCVCVRRAHGACESTHGVKVSAEIRFLEM